MNEGCENEGEDTLTFGEGEGEGWGKRRTVREQRQRRNGWMQEGRKEILLCQIIVQ